MNRFNSRMVCYWPVVVPMDGAWRMWGVSKEASERPMIRGRDEGMEALCADCEHERSGSSSTDDGMRPECVENFVW